MKKCVLTITSVLLSLCMIICPTVAVSAVDGTEPSPEAELSTSENGSFSESMNVEGSNDLGNLIGNELALETSKQQESLGNYIYSVRITDNIAKVDFKTTAYCNIVVGIYDEQGIQMFTSGSADVNPDIETINIPLDTDKMPEYFYIKAYMVEKVTLKPLGRMYESPNYTQSMIEFFAKTTQDFNEEQVLNLDEDNTNNFMVFDDDVRQIVQSQTTNHIALVDKENRLYVFENINTSISSLQPGDIFTTYSDDDDLLIVKVADITINGTTANIHGEDTSLEEVFQYVKIDTFSDLSDADIDNSNLPEGVTASDEEEPKTTSTSGNLKRESESNKYFDIDWWNQNLQAGVSETKSISYDFDKEGSFSYGGTSTSGSLKGNASLKMTLAIKCFIERKGEKYVEFRADYELITEIHIAADINCHVQIGRLEFTPVKGVNVVFEPYFEFQSSVKLDASFTVTGTVGFKASAANGLENITTKPETDPSVHLEGRIYIGLDLQPSINIIDEDIVKAYLIAKLGVELVAELDLFQDAEEVKHLCHSCTKGVFNFLFSLTIGVRLLDDDDYDWNKELLNKTIKINDFYESDDFDEFGWGECPHKQYRCTVTVKDSKNSVVSGAVVNDEYITNESGKVTFYIKPGRVTLTATKDGETGIYSGNIDGAKTIIIKLGSSQGSAIPSGGSSGGNSWIGNYDEDSDDISNGTDWLCASGGTHSLAVSKAGVLYTWGKNDYGQLGNGETSDESFNGPYHIMDNVVSVCTGSYYSAAVTSDGKVYAWGQNDCGQFGNSTNEDSLVPVYVMDNAKAVYSSNGSNKNTFIITKNNELYAFGNWYYNYPIKLMSSVKKFYAGNSVCAVIDENDDLYTFGNNRYGQLGIGYGKDSNYYPNRRIMSDVKKIAINNSSTATVLAIRNNGELYSWGENTRHICGTNQYAINDSNRYIWTPQLILTNVVDADLSNYSGGAVTNDGKLYTWGTETNGLGNGNYVSRAPELAIDGEIKRVYKSYYAIDNGGHLLRRNGLYFEPYLDSIQCVIGNIIISYDDGVLDSSLYSSSLPGGKFVIEAVKSTSTSASTKSTGRLTKTYTDLKPEGIYNFYVMKDTKAENLLNNDNLYYITQEQADENGELSITYAPTEDYETAHRFVVAMDRTDLSYATVMADKMIYNGEEQYITPSVKLDGTYLKEGVDYELTGEYSAKETGEYTVTISGIGTYTGKIDFKYNILPAFVNLSALEKTQIYIGETITIHASANGGEGAYTYSYYFRSEDEPSWIPLQTDTTETDVIFEPEGVGTYYARIDVTDETGEIRKKAIMFSVDLENLTNKSTVSAESIKVGNTLKLYGKAVGGAEPYQYAYYMKDMFSDTWKCLKTFSGIEQLNVNPSQEGTYDVCIKVRDANDTIAKRYFIVDVKPNKLSPEEIEQGIKTEAVAATCTEDGNIEYYFTDGKYYQFKDNSYIEISLNETIIPKTGHNYVYNENSTSTSEGHTMVCTHCGDTLIHEHTYQDNLCSVCGYANEDTNLINWNDVEIEFTDESNGLYAYTKRMIAPEFIITYNGQPLEEYEDFDFTEDSETESKRAGKHTVTVFDKNDETNTFSFDYYIYNLGITATETANSDSKIKFTATRNADKVNVTKFGMVFDRKGTFKESLSLENRTNISTTTTKSTSKYNVNVADSGKGVYARPYMQVTLNGENYIAYGEVQFFTRYTPEQIAVPTVQDIEPQLVNGKVSVKVQKPVYDTEVYTCKEMGVIFSKNGTITSLENAQTSNILIYENVGNGNVSKGYVNGAKISEQSLDNYSSYSANIGFVNGNPVYTRAYVIFTNKNTNEDMVVYGNYFVTNQ